MYHMRSENQLEGTTKQRDLAKFRNQVFEVSAACFKGVCSLHHRLNVPTAGAQAFHMDYT
jgi:hypothetical protein